MEFFGTSVACLLANIYLTELDRQIERAGAALFSLRGLLLLSPSRERAESATERLEQRLTDLRLKTKASHRANLRLDKGAAADPAFTTSSSFRHLGLLFRIAGGVALSREKQRKVQNLFRYAFRRKGGWRKQADPQARAQALVNLAADTVEKGIRNVAILDYYLKHVNDEGQLHLLDRWLAEEVLSRVFGGHKKAHFRQIRFRGASRDGAAFAPAPASNDL